MIEIETLMTCGHQIALYAMREPFQSWKKSDTNIVTTETAGELVVGPNDKGLSMTLAEAGPEHAKHLRMVMVWARIKAPRYWWIQFSTYRIGVESVSTSTMHTLMHSTLLKSDFSGETLPGVIDTLNTLILMYKAESDPEKRRGIWQRIINNLPQSYIQERTVMMSYAAIRNMYRQRVGHKLGEWAEFRRWAEGLPQAWMITDEDGENDA